MRSVQVKETAPLPRHNVEVTCTPEKFELKDSDSTVFVRNPTSFPVQVALESGAGDDEILTAARVTNWQEFRDLFATEVISPTEQVMIGSQIILFTDLRGSTAMYSAIGDAPAYAMVREHFRILHGVISEHHGGVVKTIGDSVMATFSDLGEALNAAYAMHDRLTGLETKKHVRLKLKCAPPPRPLPGGQCQRQAGFLRFRREPRRAPARKMRGRRPRHPRHHLPPARDPGFPPHHQAKRHRRHRTIHRLSRTDPRLAHPPAHPASE